MRTPEPDGGESPKDDEIDAVLQRWGADIQVGTAQRIAAAILVAFYECSPDTDEISKWLLAALAGMAGVAIAKLDTLLAVVGRGGVSWGLFWFVVSFLAAMGQKWFRFRLAIALAAFRRAWPIVEQVLDMHHADEERLKTVAAEHGKTASASADVKRLVPGLRSALPWYLRWRVKYDPRFETNVFLPMRLFANLAAWQFAFLCVQVVALALAFLGLPFFL